MAVSDTSRPALSPRAGPFRNLQASVLDELGRLIVAGEVQPGDALPTEPELAQAFGVGKSVIREATRGLAAKGLVRTRPRIGTRVQPKGSWHMLDPDVLSWQLAAVPDHELLRDFEEFRLAVEPMSARLAAERATPEDRLQLRDALDRMHAHEDADTYFTADLDFHAGLLAATHNRMMQGLIDAIRSALQLRHSTVARVVVSLEESLPYHEHVFQAVEGRDPRAAATAMLDLLQLTIRDDHLLRDDDPHAPVRPGRRADTHRRPH